MDLKKWIGLGASRSSGELDELVARLRDDVRELKEEKERLEGLLDVGDELDGGLPGNQAQKYYRPILTAQLSRAEEDRDFDDFQRRRILKTSHTAYALQGSAEDLIDTHLDFLLGDELRLITKDTKLQDVLDDVWEEPRNDMAGNCEEYTRSLLIEGELFLEATLLPADGTLEIGWLDPLRVKDVLQDSRGRDAIVLVDGTSTTSRKEYFVLDSLNDRIEVEKLAGAKPYRITETTIDDGGAERKKTRDVDGLIFAEFWTRPKGARRGRGELGSVLDLIDAYDELLWSTVDVQNLKRFFMIWVTSPTIKQPGAGKKFLEAMGLKTPPRNPRTYATNDKVKLEIVQAQAKDSEKWLAGELGTAIMGAKAFPEGWRGSQSEKGLAGARASEFKPLRRLRRKQKKLLRIWRRVVDVQLELRRRAGVEIPEADWEIQTMEVGGKDKQRLAETLKSIAAAIVQAISAGVIKEELGNALFVQLAKDLGAEIPRGAEGVPKESQEEVQQALAKKLEDQVRQLGSQRSDQDEGQQSEEDRQREEEGAAA